MGVSHYQGEQLLRRGPLLPGAPLWLYLLRDSPELHLGFFGVIPARKDHTLGVLPQTEGFEFTFIVLY